MVDDGITDETRREATNVSSNPQVRVVGYGKNQGKGYAVKFVSRYATGGGAPDHGHTWPSGGFAPHERVD